MSYSTRFFRLVDGEPDAFEPDVLVATPPQSIIDGRDHVLEWILAR